MVRKHQDITNGQVKGIKPIVTDAYNSFFKSEQYIKLVTQEQ